MLQSAVIITQEKDIKEILKEAIYEIEKEKAVNTPDKLYTINQVAKRLGRAHDTINKLAKSGVIRTTKDGLITESAISEYLGQ